MSETDRLAVAICPPLALAVVHGRGTFPLAPALKQFGRSAYHQGCRKLIVDTMSCTGMDSTFLGVLAGLGRVFSTEGQGGVILMNAGEGLRALLTTLGLDTAVEICPAGVVPEPLRGMMPEACAYQDLEATRERRESLVTMMEAHETLASISPANRVRFQDVLEYLRREAEGESGSASSSQTP